MSMSVYSFPKDLRVAKILIASHILELDVQQNEVEYPTVTGSEDWQAINPSGKLPFLKTEHGVINGTNTILRYICSQRPGLYGSDNFTTSSIDAWVDWSNGITLISASWLYPVWGLEQEDLVNRDISALNLFRELTHLNTHLTGKDFLVGTSFSLADLSDLYSTVLDKEFRGHFPEVNRWLTSTLNKQEVVSVIGDITFCEATPTPPLPHEIFTSSPVPSLVSLLKQEKKSEKDQPHKRLVVKHKPHHGTETSPHSFEGALEADTPSHVTTEVIANESDQQTPEETVDTQEKVEKDTTPENTEQPETNVVAEQIQPIESDHEVTEPEATSAQEDATEPQGSDDNQEVTEDVLSEAATENEEQKEYQAETTETADTTEATETTTVAETEETETTETNEATETPENEEPKEYQAETTETADATEATEPVDNEETQNTEENTSEPAEQAEQSSTEPTEEKIEEENL